MKAVATILFAAGIASATASGAQPPQGNDRIEKDCEAQYHAATPESQRTPAGKNAFVKECFRKGRSATSGKSEKSCLAQYHVARGTKATTLSQSAFVSDCLRH